MDRRKLNWITMAFVVLTVLVVGLMLSHTLRRSTHITLPEVIQAENGQDGPSQNESMLSVVKIAPDTVQAAIATLKRPENYQRSVTIEHNWNGGSGSYEVHTAVRNSWTRVDRSLPDGQLRHSVTDGETTYIWYNASEDVLELSAGEISADNEQAIPTYEAILSLPAEDIAAADYRDFSGLRCIYVETLEDEEGYSLRYWVNVDSGLLIAAEKMLSGASVYRMSALDLETTEVPAELFQLPNGKNLI